MPARCSSRNSQSCCRWPLRQTSALNCQLSLANGAEFATLLNESEANAGRPPIFDNPEQFGAGTDWQDLIFDDAAPLQNHQLSVSGGSDQMTYHLSGNYFRQYGVVTGSNFQRVNLRLNNEYFVSDNVMFGHNITFTYRDSKDEANQPIVEHDIATFTAADHGLTRRKREPFGAVLECESAATELAHGTHPTGIATGSLLLFRRIFGDRHRPVDAHVLDKEGQMPQAYAAEKAPSAFERELWAQFWTLANDVYDARQAKRLFGLIGGGACLGGAVGAGITATRVEANGSDNLLLVSAITLSICVVLVLKIVRLDKE